MQGAYIAGDLAELLITYLDAEKLSAPLVRRQLANIPPNSRISMALWWQLLEQIQAIQNLPALGLRIGRYVRPHHSGVLGYLTMYCDTLGEALQRFQRYQSLLHNFSAVDLQMREQSLTMSWDVEQGRSSQLSDEVFLSGLVSFARQVTAHSDIHPLAVSFNHQVNFPLHHYEELMGCPIRFGAERVSIELPLSALALQLNNRDPHMLALLEKQSAALLAGDSQEDDFLVQLRQLLVELLTEGDVSLDTAATKMHVSARTLHRRLADRQTNFKAVLRKTREQLARMYLADENLSLQEAAFLLGYAEQSTFSRACRQWFGDTPRQVRRQLSEA
ncbi:MAG: AraC family transcriptional regulator ligand-binding domain-containing protein [Spongiibacteraceae bacterium]